MYPAPKKQRISMFDSNNIYHQTSNMNLCDSMDCMESINHQNTFNYRHRRPSSSSTHSTTYSRANSYSNSHSDSHSNSNHSQINSTNCLSLLQLNNNNNNEYNSNKDEAPMTKLLNFLDEQDLNKLKQTSNKMAQITNQHQMVNISNNYNNNIHLSRTSYSYHHQHHCNQRNNDGQYVESDRSSYHINIDNNENTQQNNNYTFNLNNTSSLNTSISIMSTMTTMSSMTSISNNTFHNNCNSAIKCNNVISRKFRSFTHINEEEEQEFALNNIEFDDDIDQNMSMAANYHNTEKETRNYNTSVSNTLSPLSILHIPANSPNRLDTLDNFKLNTNTNTNANNNEYMTSISIMNSNHNHHSTIIGHRINDHAEDGNDDIDIYDQNRCSVLDVLNDIQEFRL